MKKTLEKFLSLFLSVLLVLTTVNINVFASSVDKTNKNEKNLYVKNFSVTGEKEVYFSGEEVLLDLNLELVDDVGTIEDSYIEIKLPKEFIDKETISASDISSLDFEFNISEDRNEYILKYKLKTVSSSTRLSIPLRFRTLDYLTPNNYILPIKSSYNFNNQLVHDNLQVEIKSGDFKSELYLIDKAIGSLGHSNSENQKLYAGFIDEETGKLSMDSKNLNTINIGYVLKNTMEEKGKNVGNRRFQN